MRQPAGAHPPPTGTIPDVLTPSEAKTVLTELLEAAAGDAQARTAGASKLAGMEPQHLVRLDDNARHGWPWGGLPWNVLPTGLSALQESTGLVAALASMHPDGRLRQRAAAALARLPAALPAALLSLRCVDHVAQVREEAAAALASHVSVDAARNLLPVLLAVAGRAHGAAALSRYTDALLARHGDPRVLLGLLDVPDRRARRWAFTACLDAGLLTVADLLRAAHDRHDRVIRRHAAEHLAAHRDAAGSAPLRALLTSRYADSRVAALVALPDDELTDDDLRAVLLDRSPRVRDTARWRAQGQGMDVAAFYRATLDVADDQRATVASLTGLGWVGDQGDLPAVERRLDHSSPSVRVAAIQCVVARSEPGEVADRLGPMLLDPSPRVVSVAARALGQAGSAATRDAERAAWASAQPWSRRAAWRIGRTRGGWDRVEADLRAAGDPDLSEVGRSSLREWLRTSAATTWHRPQGARAERLAALLTNARLDEDTTRLVAFHAGLPRADAQATPNPPRPALLGGDLRRGWWQRLRPRRRPAAQ